MKTCTDCRYFRQTEWNKQHARTEGYCIRYPRIVACTGMDDGNCSGGSTYADAYTTDEACGEFRRPPTEGQRNFEEILDMMSQDPVKFYIGEDKPKC